MDLSRAAGTDSGEEGLAWSSGLGVVEEDHGSVESQSIRILSTGGTRHELVRGGRGKST